jgi:hypothetical protein
VAHLCESSISVWPDTQTLTVEWPDNAPLLLRIHGIFVQTSALVHTHVTVKRCTESQRQLSYNPLISLRSVRHHDVPS